MDRVAAKMANVLVGNEDAEAVLEFCLIGPILYFDETVNIAVSGGDFGIDVEGTFYPADRPVRVPAGKRVKITTGQVGIYGTLAVGGGLDIPPVMGSRSTNLRCGIGGFRGRTLAAGDEIPLRNPENGRKDLSWRWVPPRRLVSPDDPDITRVRVIPGPQENMFTPKGLQTFYDSSYEITSHSDRMGCRLSGPVVESTGGYAKIASVITVDLPLFAQLRPGQKVRFDKCSVQEAQKLLREEDKMWKDHCRMLEENSPDNYNPCRFRFSDAGRNRSGCRNCRHAGWAERNPGRIRRKSGRKSAGWKPRVLRDEK